MGSWGRARADDAVALISVGVLLLLVPDTGLLADRLTAVGIGLDLVDLVGLLALSVGLLLSVAAGSARVLGVVLRRSR